MLAVVALLFGSMGDARAGGNVDWSDYIDKDGASKLPAQKTPVVADSSDDAPAPAAKATRDARPSKAKTSKKAKAKPRAKKSAKVAKTKKRRR